MISNNDGKNIHRYDTKTNWIKYNPILAKGELVFEDDNGNIRQKIGNGSSTYNNLPYVGNACPYNIGDIYITMREGNPNTIWKGTQWEQIEQGVVLLSQGSNYPLGSKGGEATHTLTVSELPKHKHHYGRPVMIWTAGNNRNEYGKDTPPVSGNIGTLGDDGGYYSDRLINQCQYVNDLGGNMPHNNLPPYISVYLWKRTS